MQMTPLRILGTAGALLLVAALIGGGWYSYRTVTILKSDLASTTTAYEETHAAFVEAKEQSDALATSLLAEKRKNGDFETQIQDIASTVTTLDKLAKTDPELLQKYSKVYFLNENYVPSALSDIDATYIEQKGRKLEFHTEALPFLEDMLNAAEDDDIHLLLISSYRSFGTQAALKSSYTVTYGTGANKFSADQGYSEHQLGTAVDLTTKALGENFSNGFEKTDGYAWLVKNAWRYGFILSYPFENKYYQYEPWHWRFVGIELATHLHETGLHFYDLEQRDLDSYLPSLFDTD